MRYQELGKTGINVPPIVFGTSALGNLYAALNDDIKMNIVSECLKHMARPVVFDCAGKYGAGLALEMLGKLLSKLNVDENDVIISNKLGWIRIPLESDEPTFEPGVWKDLKYDAKQKISYKGIMTCWEQGIELIGEKFKPQFVSVHDPDEYLDSAENEKEKEKKFSDILDAYKALLELKKLGKVKAVGVGAKNWRIIEKISGYVDLDWVMFANSLTIMNHPTSLLSFMDKIHQRGVGIINSAVFHAGFLTGGDYYDYKLIKPDNEENRKRFLWREKFFILCKKHNVVPATACVNFAMTPPGVVSIALNTSKPENVKKNIESVTSEIQPKFWVEMKKEGLIRKDYPYLKI